MKVPSIVFVKNQQFLKDVMTIEFQNDERQRMEARHQCEVNLYTHYLLKSEGLQSSQNIDYGIAMSFCDMGKTGKQQLKFTYKPIVSSPDNLNASVHSSGIQRDFAGLAIVNKTESSQSLLAKDDARARSDDEIKEILGEVQNDEEPP